MRARRSAVPLLAVPLLLSGCGSSGSTADAAGPTTTAATRAPTAASPGSPTTAASGGGCAAGGGSVPAGAATKQTLDADGDGRPDTEWIAASPGSDGGVPFGVATASGAVFSATIRSASPVPRSVLVADVTGAGELVALAGDGRQVQLYAISACRLVPVQNAQGRQYTFDLQDLRGTGTGVGCTDVDGDGVRDLVGLRAAEPAVEETVVRLSGPHASNGVRRTIDPATEAQLAAATQVTCGDRTLAADGVATRG